MALLGQQERGRQPDDPRSTDRDVGHGTLLAPSAWVRRYRRGCRPAYGGRIGHHRGKRMDAPLTITDPAFWHLPARGAHGATSPSCARPARSSGPHVENPMTGVPDDFFAGHPLRRAGRDQPPRRGLLLGPGRHEPSPTCRAEALEFFGSFIDMDDPRHARQRGIVGPLLHPPAAGRACSTRSRRICTEVVDDMCEQGEVDLVEAIVAAVPAADHLRHDGHPPQRVQDRARRHERDPRRRRPRRSSAASEHHRGAVRRRHAAHHAHERAGRGAAQATRPTTSPPRSSTTPSATRTCSPRTRSPRSSSSSRWPATTPPAPPSAPACTCSPQNPDQRKIWQDDLDGVTGPRGRGDRAGRVAGHVHAPHRHPRPHPLRPRLRRGRQAHPLLRRRQPRPPRVRRPRDASTSAATRTPTSASAGPGPHFCLGAHLARREVAVMFRQLLTRLPDIEITGDPVPLEAHGHPAGRRHQAPPGDASRPTARVGAA